MLTSLPLPVQCVRLAFVLARATPAEREQMGATDLPGAVRWCGTALKDSGWASRGRPAGAGGSGPGQSSGGSGGGGGAFSSGGGSGHLTGW